MRRQLGTLLVGVLLVTAGCLGPAGPGGDATTSTTAPASTTPEPTSTTAGAATTTVADGPLAPGVERDGSLNVSALLDAHAAVLLERGAVVESNYSLGDATESDRRAVLAAGLDRLHVSGTRTADGTTYRSAQWVNETVFVARTTSGGRTQYHGSERLPDRHHRETALQSHQLDDLLTGGSFAVEEVTTEDGTRRVTLASTGYEGDQFRNLSVELAVTGAGVVESLSAEGELDDGREFAFDYRVARLGVESVARPDWVADAPPIVTARLSFDFVNCTRTYLRLVHEEGDPLPAGSTVEITANGTAYTATLDSRLPRDGSRYIYLTEDGLRASTEKPSGDVVDIGNEVQVRVVTGGGLLVTSGSMGFGCESASEGSGGSGESGSASGGGSGESSSSSSRSDDGA